MPIALTPNETWRFQLPEDYLPVAAGETERKPDPLGTWWILRALPSEVWAQIEDAMKMQTDPAGGGDFLCGNSGTINRLALQYGVVGVENWKDANGRDVPFKLRTLNGREVADLAFLDYMMPKHWHRLARAVIDRQKVALDEGN